MSKEFTPDGFAPEEWTYKGIVFSGGKLACIWIDGTGNGLVYEKAKDTAGSVGGIYSIEVQRDGGSTRARFGTKRYLRTHPDSLELATWRLENATAEGELAAEKLEQRLRKEDGDIGALTLREVRTMLSKRRGWRQRQALVAMVLEYIG